MVLFALLATAAAADRPLYQHAVQLGAGSHFGGAGVGYTYRLDERFAGSVGAGSLGFGAAARYHPVRLLFVQLGISPLATTSDGALTIYGPDAMVGIDLQRSRFSLTIGAGMGMMVPTTRTTTTLDIGLGVNFGPKGDAAEEAP